MASIEVGPLSHNLDEDEIDVIKKAFADAELKLGDLDEDADGRLIERDVDDDFLAGFLDRLDASEAACDIYVPEDFEETVVAGETCVGSAYLLLAVLEEMRDEVSGGDLDDEDEEDEEYGEYGDLDDEEYEGGSAMVREATDGHLRHLWGVLARGAQTCIDERICLFIHR